MIRLEDDGDTSEHILKRAKHSHAAGVNTVHITSTAVAVTGNTGAAASVMSVTSRRQTNSEKLTGENGHNDVDVRDISDYAHTPGMNTDKRAPANVLSSHTHTAAVCLSCYSVPALCQQIRALSQTPTSSSTLLVRALKNAVVGVTANKLVVVETETDAFLISRLSTLDQGQEHTDECIELIAVLSSITNRCPSAAARVVDGHLHSVLIDIMRNQTSQVRVQAACMRALAQLLRHCTKHHRRLIADMIIQSDETMTALIAALTVTSSNTLLPLAKHAAPLFISLADTPVRQLQLVQAGLLNTVLTLLQHLTEPTLTLALPIVSALVQRNWIISLDVTQRADIRLILSHSLLHNAHAIRLDASQCIVRMDAALKQIEVFRNKHALSTSELAAQVMDVLSKTPALSLSPVTPVSSSKRKHSSSSETRQVPLRQVDLRHRLNDIFSSLTDNSLTSSRLLLQPYRTRLFTRVVSLLPHIRTDDVRIHTLALISDAHIISSNTSYHTYMSVIIPYLCHIFINTLPQKSDELNNILLAILTISENADKQYLLIFQKLIFTHLIVIMEYYFSLKKLINKKIITNLLKCIVNITYYNIDPTTDMDCIPYILGYTIYPDISIQCYAFAAVTNILSVFNSGLSWQTPFMAISSHIKNNNNNNNNPSSTVHDDTKATVAPLTLNQVMCLPVPDSIMVRYNALILLSKLFPLDRSLFIQYIGFTPIIQLLNNEEELIVLATMNVLIEIAKDSNTILTSQLFNITIIHDLVNTLTIKCRHFAASMSLDLRLRLIILLNTLSASPLYVSCFVTRIELIRFIQNALDISDFDLSDECCLEALRWLNGAVIGRIAEEKNIRKSRFRKRSRSDKTNSQRATAVNGHNGDAHSAVRNGTDPVIANGPSQHDDDYGDGVVTMNDDQTDGSAAVIKGEDDMDGANMIMSAGATVALPTTVIDQPTRLRLISESGVLTSVARLAAMEESSAHRKVRSQAHAVLFTVNALSSSSTSSAQYSPSARRPSASMNESEISASYDDELSDSEEPSQIHRRSRTRRDGARIDESGNSDDDGLSGVDHTRIDSETIDDDDMKIVDDDSDHDGDVNIAQAHDDDETDQQMEMFPRSYLSYLRLQPSSQTALSWRPYAIPAARTADSSSREQISPPISPMSPPLPSTSSHTPVSPMSTRAMLSHLISVHSAARSRAAALSAATANNAPPTSTASSAAPNAVTVADLDDVLIGGLNPRMYDRQHRRGLYRVAHRLRRQQLALVPSVHPPPPTPPPPPPPSSTS